MLLLLSSKMQVSCEQFYFYEFFLKDVFFLCLIFTEYYIFI